MDHTINGDSMVYFFIWLALIILIISNIELRVSNIRDITKIKIKLLYFITIPIKSKKVEQKIKSFKSTSLADGVDGFKQFLQNREIIDDFLAKISIKRLHIVYYEPVLDINIRRAFFISNLMVSLKSACHELFLNIEDESYLVRVRDKADIDFDIDAKINLFYLIFIMIKNIKKIHTIKKESRNNV